MDKLKEKEGITLITLVITVIILLILAGISIATLTGENSFISKAKLAQIEQKKAQAKEELQLKISQLQLKITDEEVREATLNDFNNLIEEDEELTFISASYNTASTKIVQGEFKTIKVLYRNYIFTVDEQLVIIQVEENTDITNVDLNYEIKSVSDKDGKIIYNVLIIVESNKKITKVECGEQILKTDTGTEKISMDFEAEKDIKYKFKINTLNGKEVEKIFSIDKEIMTGIELTKTSVWLVKGKEDILKFNILPYNAFYQNVKWETSDSTIVTVYENGKIVASGTKEGTANVTVTVQDGISKTYTANCMVSVLSSGNGYMIDIIGVQSGNCVSINEIELYNSKDELLTTHSVNVYDSVTKGKPDYWNSEIWGGTHLFDGNKNYGEYSSTIFLYETSSKTKYARLFIYNLLEEVNTIKIYSGAYGSDRHPVKLSVGQIMNDETTSWGIQPVSAGVSAENIFTRP